MTGSSSGSTMTNVFEAMGKAMVLACYIALLLRTTSAGKASNPVISLSLKIGGFNSESEINAPFHTAVNEPAKEARLNNPESKINAPFPTAVNEPAKEARRAEKVDYCHVQLYKRTNLGKKIQDHYSHMRIEFVSCNNHIELTMTINHNVFARDSIIYNEETGEGEEPKSYSYRGTFRRRPLSEVKYVEEGPAALTLHTDNRRFDGVLFGEKLWIIDRHEVHTDGLKNATVHGVDEKHGLLVWHSDLESVSIVNQWRPRGTNTEKGNADSRRLAAAKQPEYVPFANCWWSGPKPLKKYITIGFFVDESFLQVSRSTASRSVQKIVNLASVIYERQLNIGWQIGNIYVAGQAFPSVDPPLSSLAAKRVSRRRCNDGLSIEARMETMEKWKIQFHQNLLKRNLVSTDNSLWHLLTNCHEAPGVVGLAFIQYASASALCQKYANLGISNYMRSGTWKVVAHEIGHNFGAHHSFENKPGMTGGIMDYGNSRYNRTVQFNIIRKNEVCATIRNVLRVGSQGSAYILPTHVCLKDGRAGPGKPTNPSNPSTYEWIHGAFGACTPSCGITRMRISKVLCVRRNTTNPMNSHAQTAAHYHGGVDSSSSSSLNNPHNADSSSDSSSNAQRWTTRCCGWRLVPPCWYERTGYPNYWIRRCRMCCTRVCRYYAYGYAVGSNTTGQQNVSTTAMAPDSSTGLPRRPAGNATNGTAHPDKIVSTYVTAILEPEERCSPESKPLPNAVMCSPVTCPAPSSPGRVRCGNSRLDPGEECEYSLGHSCCSKQCTRKTNCECVRSNRRVDASFKDSQTGYTYLFQDRYFSRYDPGHLVEAGHLAEAAPRFRGRLLSSLVGLDEFFHNGISAACEDEGGKVFLFKGQKVGIYNFEIGSMATIHGADSSDDHHNSRDDDEEDDSSSSSSSHVHLTWDVFQAPAEFRRACAQSNIGVTSALSKQRHVLIFCGQYYTKCLLSSKRCGTTIGQRGTMFPVSVLGLNFGVGQSLPVSASMSLDSDVDVFYSGNLTVRRSSATDASVPQLNPEFGAIRTGCPRLGLTDHDPNCNALCETCEPASRRRCKSCPVGFKLHGHTCISVKILAMLLFDTDSDSVELDRAMLLEGQASINLLKSRNGYGEGIFQQAGKLDKNFKLAMAPLEHGLKNWAVSMYIKPISVSATPTIRTLITVRQANGKQVKIMIKTSGGLGSTWEINVDYLGTQLPAFIMAGPDNVRFDPTTFHLLEVRFKDDMVTTIYNNFQNEMAFNRGGHEPLTFRDWWLGDSLNGADAYLDTLKLIDLKDLKANAPHHHYFLPRQHVLTAWTSTTTTPFNKFIWPISVGLSCCVCIWIWICCREKVEQFRRQKEDVYFSFQDQEPSIRVNDVEMQTHYDQDSLRNTNGLLFPEDQEPSIRINDVEMQTHYDQESPRNSNGLPWAN